MSKQEKQPRADREAFAAFDDGHEEKEPKKARPRKRWCFIVMAAALVCVLVLAVARFGQSDMPLTTAQTGLGVVDDTGRDENGRNTYRVLHTAVGGFGLIQTDTKQASQKTLSPDAVAYITRYRGKTYYYDATEGTLLCQDGIQARTVYKGAVRQPFFDGRFVYFIGGEGNVSGFLYRVPLSGGEAEPVLSVKTTAFILYKGSIIYYDPAINAVVSVKRKTAEKTARNSEETTSAALRAEVLLADTYTTVFGVAENGLYFLDGGDLEEYQRSMNTALTGMRLCRFDLATGERTDVSRGLYAQELVVTSEALYYVSAADGHVYRCNGSGADIRDLTGRDAAYPYAVTIHDGFCLFRAFRPQISETMQTTYEPMIGVCTVSGERVLAIDDIDTVADES